MHMACLYKSNNSRRIKVKHIKMYILLGHQTTLPDNLVKFNIPYKWFFLRESNFAIFFEIGGFIFSGI